MLVDTLKAQRRLVEEYGVEKRAAEGIVEILSDAENQIATKDDLALLRKDFDGLRAEFEMLGKRMDARFDAVDERFSTQEQRVDDRFDAVDDRFSTLEQRINVRMDARIRKLEVRLYGVIFAATSLLAALNFFTS
jgi:hypothetical protein